MGPAASTAHEASAPESGARFLPTEVEPRGDEGGGLGCEPPAARPSWLGRTRVAFGNSVWAPVGLKLFGLALGMLALSGVGVASILNGVGGVQVPLAAMLGTDIHAAWLASKPSTSTSTRAPAALAGNGSGVGSLAAPGSASAAASASGAPAPVTDGATPAGTTASSGMTEDGKVILNLAGVADLRHLPGVGQKRADAILALRTRLGRFKQVSDLLRVKGIGVRGLKKIQPHVVLDATKSGSV